MGRDGGEEEPPPLAMCLVQLLISGNFEHELRESRPHQAPAGEKDQHDPYEVRDAEDEDEARREQGIDHDRTITLFRSGFKFLGRLSNCDRREGPSVSL